MGVGRRYDLGFQIALTQSDAFTTRQSIQLDQRLIKQFSIGWMRDVFRLNFGAHRDPGQMVRPDRPGIKLPVKNSQ